MSTVTSQTDPQLEQDFPNLAASGYRVTSDPSDVPNCIGWALYDQNHFWDPDGWALRMPGYMWLPTGPFDWKLETVTEIFRRHGYEICASVELEPGYEKVALYFNDNDPDCETSHVARQLATGLWTSKLGVDQDIEHNTLAALEGDTLRFPKAYGKSVRVLKRPRR